MSDELTCITHKRV